MTNKDDIRGRRAGREEEWFSFENMLMTSMRTVLFSFRRSIKSSLHYSACYLFRRIRKIKKNTKKKQNYANFYVEKKELMLDVCSITLLDIVAPYIWYAGNTGIAQNGSTRSFVFTLNVFAIVWKLLQFLLKWHSVSSIINRILLLQLLQIINIYCLIKW